MDGVKPARRREVWTDEEHGKFVEALAIHHRNWKEVATHVGTKTVVQVSIFMFTNCFRRAGAALLLLLVGLLSELSQS